MKLIDQKKTLWIFLCVFALTGCTRSFWTLWKGAPAAEAYFGNTYIDSETGIIKKSGTIFKIKKEGITGTLGRTDDDIINITDGEKVVSRRFYSEQKKPREFNIGDLVLVKSTWLNPSDQTLRVLLVSQELIEFIVEGNTKTDRIYAELSIPVKTYPNPDESEIKEITAPFLEKVD